MREILDHLRTRLDSGHKVYVHCWGGIGRTGTVVGCHLVEQGMTADQALEQARQYGGNRVHTTATLGRMAHAGMMTSSHATFPTSLH